MRRKMRDARQQGRAVRPQARHADGLIDVEFLIQYLVLGHSHDHPRLTGNLGNIALLRIAGELGLIPAGLAAACADSYREAPPAAPPAPQRAPLAHRPGRGRSRTRRPVRALWRHVFGE